MINSANTLYEQHKRELQSQLAAISKNNNYTVVATIPQLSQTTGNAYQKAITVQS